MMSTHHVTVQGTRLAVHTAGAGLQPDAAVHAA